jgi:transposase
VTPVAIARTGAYWHPVSHLLEGTLTVFVVNAAHVNHVPGRHTDKADARWWATLRRSGLLHASFLPPHGPRDLRARPRYRTQVVQERRREVNRVQGGLERATSTLASVATARMGVSRRAMVEACSAGRTQMPPRGRRGHVGACAARSPCSPRP